MPEMKKVYSNSIIMAAEAKVRSEQTRKKEVVEIIQRIEKSNTKFNKEKLIAFSLYHRVIELIANPVM